MRVLRYAPALVVTCATAVHAEAAIEGELVWQNLTKPGRATELRLSFNGDPPPHRVSVSFTQAGATHRHQLQTHPAIREYSLPAVLQSADPLEVLVTSGTSTYAAAKVYPQQISETLVVSNLPQAALEQYETPNLIIAETERFPRHAAGYGSVDLILLHARSAHLLDPDQRTALRTYIDMCGRTIVVADTDSTWHASPACEGMHIHLGETAGLSAQLSNATRKLHLQPTSNLPKATAVARLNPVDRTPVENLIGLGFIAYFVVMALAAIRPNHTSLLAGTPVAFCTAILLIPTGTDELRITSWGETSSTHDVYRYVSTVEIMGTQKGQIHLEVPPSAMPWRALHPRGGYLIAINDSTARPSLSLPTRLLQNHFFTTGGIRASSSALTIQMNQQKPIIRNTSAYKSHRAELVWAGDRYIVPPLESGTSWIPDEQAAHEWSDSYRDRLVRQRTLMMPAVLVLQTEPAPGELELLVVHP